jgi:hypothetical protein
MKAQVLRLWVCDQFMGLTHGDTQPQNRLFIPEADNLAIWTHGGSVYTRRGFDPKTRDRCTVISEVEVDDSFLAAVFALKATEQQMCHAIQGLLPAVDFSEPGFISGPASAQCESGVELKIRRRQPRTPLWFFATAFILILVALASFYLSNHSQLLSWVLSGLGVASAITGAVLGIVQTK